MPRYSPQVWCSLLSSFLKIFKQLHRITPSWLKKLYGPLFNWRHSDGAKGAFKTVLPVRLFTGAGIKGGQTLHLAYAGHDERLQAHWLQRVFGSPPQRQELGEMPFWKIRGFLKKHHPECGLLLSEMSPLTLPWHRRGTALIVIAWIRFGLDLTVPLEQRTNRELKGLQDARRRIRKHGLSYRICVGDREAFTHFYRNMYRPFMLQRHGDAAVVMKEHNALVMLEKGKLIQVFQGDTLLAAVGLEDAGGGQTRLKLMGLNPLPELAQLGAIPAAYYFAMQELQAHGKRYLDAGLTSPLLNDSLTAFKRHIGGELMPPASMEYPALALNFLQMSAAVRWLWKDNPLLCFDEHLQPQRMLLLDPAEVATPEAMQTLYETGVCEKVDKTVAYCLADPGSLKDWKPSFGSISFRSSNELL